jgi:hypothetical protein
MFSFIICFIIKSILVFYITLFFNANAGRGNLGPIKFSYNGNLQSPLNIHIIRVDYDYEDIFILASSVIVMIITFIGLIS